MWSLSLSENWSDQDQGLLETAGYYMTKWQVMYTA